MNFHVGLTFAPKKKTFMLAAVQVIDVLERLRASGSEEDEPVF